MDDKTRKLMFSSKNSDFGTPQKLFDKLQKRYGITIDVCANVSNAKCKKFISEEDDIFKTVWLETGFLNPPYNKPEQPCKNPCTKKSCEKRGWQHNIKYVPGQIDFVRRVIEVARSHGTTTICLLPARTDTALFHKYIWNKQKNQPRDGVTIDFIEGRIVFVGEENPAPFPSMIVVFDGTMIH